MRAKASAYKKNDDATQPKNYGQTSKKTNTAHNDEEAKGFVEQELSKNNEEKIGILADQVSQMKNLSTVLNNQITEEKSLLTGLGSGFDNTKKLVASTMQRMDGMLTKASGSMCTYIVIFTIMIIALVYKLR